MFLLVSVILSTGGSPSVHAGIPHHPPGSTPPEAHTPREADYGIRSMSGRYASYWNAFLFESVFLFCLWKRTNIGVVQTHVQFHVISAKNILCLVLANGLHTIGIFSLFLLFHDIMTCLDWNHTLHKVNFVSWRSPMSMKGVFLVASEAESLNLSTSTKIDTEM